MGWEGGLEGHGRRTMQRTRAAPPRAVRTRSPRRTASSLVRVRVRARVGVRVGVRVRVRVRIGVWVRVRVRYWVRGEGEG